MLGLLTPAVVGSLLLATLSTVADYVWFLNIPGHQVSSGLIHGAALFAALGAYLGFRKGNIVAGTLGGDRAGAEAGTQQVLVESKRVKIANMLTANAKDVEQRIKEGFNALLFSGPQADEGIKVGRAAAGR